jgi:hypothetical protein
MIIIQTILMDPINNKDLQPDQTQNVHGLMNVKQKIQHRRFLNEYYQLIEKNHQENQVQQ